MWRRWMHCSSTHSLLLKRGREEVGKGKWQRRKTPDAPERTPQRGCCGDTGVYLTEEAHEWRFSLLADRMFLLLLSPDFDLPRPRLLEVPRLTELDTAEIQNQVMYQFWKTCTKFVPLTLPNLSDKNSGN